MNFEQRVTIKFLVDDGLSPNQIQLKLVQYFCEQVCIISTIKKWIIRYRWGYVWVDDRIPFINSKK